MGLYGSARGAGSNPRPYRDPDLAPSPVNPGAHIALRAASEDAVRAFHAAALEMGGESDGAPGPRTAAMTVYYGAFIRDLDGNKMEAVWFPRT